VGRLSYYVERLTHDLAARLGAHQEVEALGGMAKAIEEGMPKLRIEEAAARTQARIDSGVQTVSASTSSAWSTSRGCRCSRSTTPRCARMQLDKLKRLRAERDETRARRRWTRSPRRARGDGNLLELGIEAARAKATVGEISDALEKVVGRHQARSRRSGRVRGRWAMKSDKVVTRARAGRRFEKAPTAAARASSSPRWARTATTAARR
jgi:methylmalonyl-CoA mutase